MISFFTDYEDYDEEILIITGKSKRTIEDNFDSNVELEINLLENGKDELLA